MNVNVNKKKIRTIDSKEWSAKHTRLRYQLVISAIIFSCISLYEISQIQIPLAFFEIEKGQGPQKSTMLIGSLLFYLFTLMSFYLRTVNERQLSSPDLEYRIVDV